MCGQAGCDRWCQEGNFHVERSHKTCGAAENMLLYIRSCFYILKPPLSLKNSRKSSHTYLNGGFPLSPMASHALEWLVGDFPTTCLQANCLLQYCSPQSWGLTRIFQFVRCRGMAVYPFGGREGRLMLLHSSLLLSSFMLVVMSTEVMRSEVSLSSRT